MTAPCFAIPLAPLGDDGASPLGGSFDNLSNFMKIKTDDLAYWFFRLNGFLSIVNFVVHKDTRSEAGGTDADILGVRFPYRAELFERPMPDYREFTKLRVVPTLQSPK